MDYEYQLFFDRLNRFGKGERSALRRATGVMLENADGKAISAFYKCLPSNVNTWQESRWFAVACLSCLWDVNSEKGEPLEKIISDLIQTKNASESTIHRIELLLDTKWDEDGYLLIKLSRFVKMVKQKTNNAYPDFTELLNDLIYWNAESQSIQRKWARTVFSKTESEEKE